MTPEEEIVRSEKARQIMEDPIVVQAFQDIEASIIEQWSMAPVKDTEVKECLWALFNASRKFKELMRSHIETGKLARAQLEQPKGWFDRFK